MRIVAALVVFPYPDDIPLEVIVTRCCVFRWFPTLPDTPNIMLAITSSA